MLSVRHMAGDRTGTAVTTRGWSARIIVSDQSSFNLWNPQRAGVIMTKTIHAVWKDGQIVPTQPIDWPEGTALSVKPIEESLVSDPEDDLLGDDPESIARWLAWFDALEPLNFTPDEETAWEDARRERRDWDKSRFDERAERVKGIFE